MTLHPLVPGFGHVAAEYERARPSYPADAVAHVVSVFGIGRSSRVADVAAGTGKLTRLLAPTAATLVAVEPVEGMRAQLRRQVPGVPVVAGVAEHMPFRSASLDAVTVAQSFHWFRAEEAMHELARVLRPGGGLAAIWNGRDEDVPWVAAFSQLVARYDVPGRPGYRSGVWRVPFDRTDAFTPIEERSFRHDQVLDREGMLERAGSMSIFAALPEERRRQALSEVADLVEPLEEPFVLPYVTTVYWCRKRS